MHVVRRAKWSRAPGPFTFHSDDRSSDRSTSCKLRGNNVNRSASPPVPIGHAPSNATQALARYVRGGHRRVEGWLHPFSAQFIAQLAALQQHSGIKGAAAEIGIHRGRLFILLHLAGSRERDLAIDIFADQHLNQDKSGRGDLDRFLKNLRQFGGDPATVQILQKNSLDISPNEIRAAVGAVALFSVDGGHTAQCALNDLRLAEGALHDAGVVILDDFFNEVWPEVCVGALDYFRDPSSRLRPFAITPNKLYLCAPAYNPFYRTEMQKRFPPHTHDKDVVMFGETVSVMGAVRYDAVRRLRHWVADSRAGPFLRRLLRSTPHQERKLLAD
jgi:methyltransferase family protein